MRDKILQVAAICLALVVFDLGATTNATVLKKLTEAEMASRAQRILIGRCTSVRSEWNEDRTKIFTYVTVSPENSLKGNQDSDEIVVKQLGGIVGDTGMHVEGSSIFEKDDEVFLYLERDREGFQRVVGFSQGMFTIKTDANSGKKVLYKKQIKAARYRDGSIRRRIVEIRSDKDLSLDEYTNRIRTILQRKRE
jgi:hypothetical protein